MFASPTSWSGGGIINEEEMSTMDLQPISALGYQEFEMDVESWLPDENNQLHVLQNSSGWDVVMNNPQNIEPVLKSTRRDPYFICDKPMPDFIQDSLPIVFIPEDNNDHKKIVEENLVGSSEDQWLVSEEQPEVSDEDSLESLQDDGRMEIEKIVEDLITFPEMVEPFMINVSTELNISLDEFRSNSPSESNQLSTISAEPSEIKLSDCDRDDSMLAQHFEDLGLTEESGSFANFQAGSQLPLAQLLNEDIPDINNLPKYMQCVEQVTSQKQNTQPKRGRGRPRKTESNTFKLKPKVIKPEVVHEYFSGSHNRKSKMCKDRICKDRIRSSISKECSSSVSDYDLNLPGPSSGKRTRKTPVRYRNDDCSEYDSSDTESDVGEVGKSKEELEKRRKNNEASKKSREKRKMLDKLAEAEVEMLEERNAQLAVMAKKLQDAYDILLAVVSNSQRT